MALAKPIEDHQSFGFIPHGMEDQFELPPTEDVLAGAHYVIDHQVPDVPVRTALGAFTWHNKDTYAVVSAITPEGQFLRATSVILPMGDVAIGGAYGETHLYRRADGAVSTGEHVRPVETKDLRPFQALGRISTQAAA